ncbi:hypothetical protein [Streptomyces broussonetiae]|uniref:Uncharacterized protein n=1 Tax=Streptomyces broussonetiae TaxID=2686304 RepID=A0A6I6N5T3_9ACTN|nr:hypothetical protein [Streptomyces broussonetiae]QHA04235.1 hypothetical protein GQF42_13890 [Streptomyces broussonetiae]
MTRRAHPWSALGNTATTAGLLTPGIAAPGAAAAVDPRTDLRVLVVDDGAGPSARSPAG